MKMRRQMIGKVLWRAVTDKFSLTSYAGNGILLSVTPIMDQLAVLGALTATLFAIAKHGIGIYREYLAMKKEEEELRALRAKNECPVLNNNSNKKL
jgi:hypothetical protein